MADLRAGGALDRVPGGVRVDLLHALHPAQPGGARHRAARRRVCLPQDWRRGRGQARGRAAVRGLVRAHARSSWEPSWARSRRAACPSATPTGDAVTSWLNPLSLLVGALFVATGAYLAAVFLISDARRAGRRRARALLPDRVRSPRRSWRACSRSRASSSLRDDARYVYDRLTDEGLPLVILSARVRPGGACRCSPRGARRGARPLAVGAVVAVIWGWGVAQYPYLLPDEPDDRRRRRPRARRSRGC